jgi:hypothetical protein
MVAGLDEELKSRLSGDFVSNTNGPTLDINRSASIRQALLPLGTAQEVLLGRSDQSSTVVDVEATSTSSNGDETSGSSSYSAKKKGKKKGFRSTVKAWAFDLVQNSVTKFK